MDRRKLLGLGLAALAAGATPALAFGGPRAYGTQALIRLPGNRPGLMIAINGKGPFLFLLDTATSHTVIQPYVAQRLAIPAIAGPTYDVVTAAGVVRSRFYLLDEVSASGVIVEGLRSVIIDLPRQFGIDGILGADFLSNFTVDLDLPGRSLTLYPQSSELNLPGHRRLRGEVNAHGFIVVPARVSNIFATAIFDSGAQYTVANARAAVYAHRYGVTLIERPIEHKVTDAAHQKTWAVSYDFDKISLGAASWTSPRVMVSDMRVIDLIGLSGRPVIFIGMDLMIGRRIILDYGQASLWLTR